MAHANAPLTEFGRLLLVQRITEVGWPRPRPRRAWACREPPPTSGWAATAPRARPGWPSVAPDPTIARTPCRPRRSVGCWPLAAVAARARIGSAPTLGMPRSTVYGVLRRHHMSRLAQTDRTSGVVVRYQRERPGELVHLDVKKLGRIPGRWRPPRPRPSCWQSWTRHRL
jgi:hypothetical protein